MYYLTKITFKLVYTAVMNMMEQWVKKGSRNSMLIYYLANPVPTLMTVLFLTLILVCTSQAECVHVLLFIGELFIFGMKIQHFLYFLDWPDSIVCNAITSTIFL